MFTMIRYCCRAGLMAAVLTVPSQSFGREPNVADVAYGAGVQFYFSGNSAEAQQRLAEAIQNNPSDPRPYYFRGLSLIRLGRMEEARAVLATGATIEAQRPGRFPVGRSLERVQGRDRLLLEEFRQQARTDVSLQQGARQRTRYEQHEAGDEGVLRQQVAVPLEDLVEPSQLPNWTRSSAAIVPPQEAAAAQNLMDRNATDAVSVDTASAEASDDPFADDAESAATPDAQFADPFAVDSAAASSPDGDASADGQKIPAEKVWGIMGRVLRRAAPLPSLEGVGRNLPFMPGGESNGNLFGAAGDAAEEDSPALPPAGGPFEFGQPPSTDSGASEPDPFGDSFDQPEPPSEERDGMEAAPGEPLDEDPFGGF